MKDKKMEVTQGNKKYEIFKTSVMDVLNFGYTLEEKESNPNIEENK